MGFEAIYKQTVTVFNRVFSGNKIFWYPTVIERVHLVIDRSIMISTYGEQASDNAMLHIQYQPSGDGGIVGGKRYLTPKVYRNIGNPNSDITFAFGDDFDFIMSGVYSEDTIKSSVKSESITATVSKDKWGKSRLGETGTYELVYTANGWTYQGSSVNLTNLGVTVTGTPAVNDKIIVKYTTKDGPIDDDDYKSGFFNYMNKTHDEVFAITNVSKFNLLPHFEITAR